jgi:uroporphyrinogen-III synthase
LPDAILITRPEPGASETAARLTAAGLHPVVAPFLSVRLHPASLPPPDRVQALIVASGNAVAALPATYRGVALLAVGDATAARARHAGFTSVLSANGDATGLAALAARQLNPAAGPLLLACGHGQSRGLAADLRRHGFRVHRRAVYTTTRVRHFPAAASEAIRDGLRAAMFFSAETAHAFVRLLPMALIPALAGVDALAIGTAAAEAVRHLPWRDVRVAVRPTQDGVLALL